MQRFADDEDGYLTWIAANANGFVVNSYRSPSAAYLVLHRADCRSISTLWSNYTTGDYIKHCSVDLAELHRWARSEVGGEPHLCGLCHP